MSKSDGTGICPTGFRVPTKTEVQESFIAENITNLTSYHNSAFKGVAGGFRTYDGTLTKNNYAGKEYSVLMTSTQSSYIDNSNGSRRYRGGAVRMIGEHVISYEFMPPYAYGLSVRCLQQ